MNCIDWNVNWFEILLFIECSYECICVYRMDWEFWFMVLWILFEIVVVEILFFFIGIWVIGNMWCNYDWFVWWKFYILGIIKGKRILSCLINSYVFIFVLIFVVIVRL